MQEDREDWADRTGFEFIVYIDGNRPVTSYPTLRQARNAARIMKPFSLHVVVKDKHGRVYFTLKDRINESRHPFTMTDVMLPNADLIAD